MATNGSLRIGQRCEILTTGTGLRASTKRYGDIAYIGAVKGLPAGDWIGVRLDKPLGKNDGSVDGVRYFEALPLHGAFVRRDKLTTDGNIPQLETQSESIIRATEERRQQLEAKRQQEKAARPDHLDQSADELVQAFWTRFMEKEDRIRRQVNLFIDQKKQPMACDPAHAINLDDQVLHIHALRDDAATAASLYLSPYDIRHTQLIIAKLLELVETTRATFAPRKKFTFKSRAKHTQAAAPSPEDSPTDNQESKSPTAHASKAYVNEDELVFADRKDEVIVIDEATFADNGEGNRRRDLNFSRLTNCTILVAVATSAIRGDTLTNCTVLTAPIWGSLWLEHCVNCEFFVACRQLRVHLSSKTSFHLRIASHPIIEDCHQLRFGAYKISFAGLNDLLEQSGLARDSGLWAKVNDFKWHKAQQSPNWSLWDPKQPLRALPEQLQQRVRYE